MTTYIYPTSTTAVSDDFATHVARKSVNPGTDYKAPYGSSVYSVASGVVTDADGEPGGSGGRTIHVNHDDGTGADYLHLSALSVSAGDRVNQGQRIGFSGASGFDDNYWYGPHLHISFRRNHAEGYGNVGNIDFDALMRSQAAVSGGNATPINTRTDDDEMISPEGLQQIRAVVRDEIVKSTTTNLYRSPGGSIAVVDVSKGFWREFGSMPDMNTLKTLGVFDPDENLQQVGQSTYDGLKKECIAAAQQFIRFATTGK